MEQETKDNLLKWLGRGLRAAGGAYSEQVYQGNLQRESQERTSRDRFEEVKAQRNKMLADQTIRAIENGTLDPAKGRAVLEKLGMGDMAVGPSMQTQKSVYDMNKDIAATAEDQRLEDAYEQEMQKYESTAAYQPPPKVANDPNMMEVWGKRQIVDDYMYKAELATKYKRDAAAKRWRELAQTEIQAQKLKADTPPKGQMVDLGDRVIVVDPTKIGDVFAKGLNPKDAAKGPETLNQKEITEIESKLRDDFWQQVGKEFTGSRDAIDRIKAAAANPSAAGDLALIYNYMRLLDPTSVVRESEFAVAASTGSYGERIKAAVQKAIDGERLSDVTRNDFVNRADSLFERAEKNYKNSSSRFTDIAKRSGADPKNVIAPITKSGMDAEKTVTESATTFPPLNERVVGKTYDTPKGRLKWTGSTWEEP